MKIRHANIGDLDAILQLFYETVTSIGGEDYDEKQLAAWASLRANRRKWLDRVQDQYFIVAEHERAILGFASLEDGEYLDVLYVHPGYQRRGIGRYLLSEIDYEFHRLGRPLIYANVSITARPFFVKQGYRVVAEQKNIVAGVELINYKMIKQAE